MTTLAKLATRPVTRARSESLVRRRRCGGWRVVVVAVSRGLSFAVCHGGFITTAREFHPEEKRP